MSDKTTATVDRDTQSYKLPRTVIPSLYQIKLSPDLQNFTFEGEESIEIDVIAPIKEILLNAVELTIHQATLKNNKESLSGTVDLDETNERASLAFDREVGAGKWTLVLKFTGILNDKLNGFYRSTYKDINGTQKVLATTQFESTDARKAFPCFDEPEYKAVYRVSLIIDEQLTAISNAAITSEKSLPGKKKEVIFADTMKMSTYLVAFLVGDFECTEAVVVDGKPIKIWSTPGKKHLAGFARSCAAACLSFFGKYYGIPYPADKLDLIAIPDFAAGAMENLGAVTFRENALLVDERTASHAELERVADVVAHELAHMWFGDLVTMKWWNGLWLNEAFATFMEMLAVDAWKPDWKRWETFSVSRAAAFAVDGLQSTRAIEFPVRHPDEAAGMFDVLTYEKGASVLRMLERYLGAEEFRKGISHYLNQHKYANAETTDLWDALEETCKQPVRQTMDSWIFHGGFPLVRVEPCDKGIRLSQQRFFYLTQEAPKGQLFEIPLMLRAKTAKGEITRKLIFNQEKLDLDLGGKVDWVVVNEGGHGFYRVAYHKDLLNGLTASLTQTLLGIERFNLVSDAWASAIAGHTSISDYLSLACMFGDEEDKNVWAVLLGSMTYLNKIIEPGQRGKFESFIRKLAQPTLNKLGWKPAAGESELKKQLRGMVIGVLGTLGNDVPVQEQARKVYDQFKSDRSHVDPNIVGPVVSILAWTGDKKVYDEFWSEYQNAKTPQDEQRYLFSLAAFSKTDLLQQTLEQTLSGQVRTQNAPYLVQAVMSNVYGRDIGWSFFKNNWEKMIEAFPENTIPRMCEGVTSLVSTKLEAEVKEFFSTHKVKQGGKTIDQHLEKLKVAVLFKNREEKVLDSALS